ncbi:hypothetical protein [Spirillospora sp. NPDC047279]|uniref:helix-turn-helix transcriptional regulator n=1 Tax=Spirillospora sp. NPDC047279 TaxID=3155478 RepID=UPI003404D460
MSTRLAVVADDRLLTESLEAWAAGVAGIELVVTVPSVQELARRRCPADLVLFSLSRDDLSALAQGVRRLARMGHRVLVVGPCPGGTAAALAAGAAGYLTKDQGLADLVRAFGTIAAGGVVFPARPERLPRLSPMERVVLLDYATGLTLEATARRAGIQPETAKTYLARVKAKYERLGRPAQTKLELAARVREDLCT